MSIQLTPEELQQFKGHRQEANRHAAFLGELNYQKVLLDFELDNLKQAIRENARKQQIQLRELGEKYGDGTIDSETGIIDPVEPK